MLAWSTRIRIMPVTERFVLVLVLDFESLRAGAEFRREWEEFRAPVLKDADTPLPRLFEDDDEDEYEDDSKCLMSIPDLLQGISTLI
jgi:hypothetical protein